MKKLLVFLGAIGLTASSSAAMISCKNTKKPVKPDANAKDPIQDLKNAFQSVNRSVITKKENEDKMTRVIDDKNPEDETAYKIFNFNYLQDQKWVNNSISLKLDNKKSADYANAINDLNHFFPKSDYIAKINELIEKNNEFRNNVNVKSDQVIGDFIFPASAEIKLTRISTKDNEGKEQFIYNVSFTFKKQFKFLDKDGKDSIFDSAASNIVALVGKNGALINTIAEMAKKAGPEIYKHYTSQLDFDKIHGQNKKFKKYGEISGPLYNTIIKSSDIQQILTQIISDTSKEQGIQFNLKTDSKIISDESLVSSNNTLFNFGVAGGAVKEGKFNVNIESNPILKNLLLKQHDDNAAKWISDEDAKTALTDIIIGFDDTIKDFREGIKNWFSDGEGSGLDTNEQINYINSAYSYGKMSLDGISVQVSQNGVEDQDIKIPTITTQWVYCVDKKASDESYISNLISSFRAINQEFVWNSAEQDPKDLLTASDALKNDITDNIVNPGDNPIDTLVGRMINNNVHEGNPKANKFIDVNGGNVFTPETYSPYVKVFTLAPSDGKVDAALEKNDLYQFNSFSATVAAMDENNDKIKNMHVVRASDGRVGIRPQENDKLSFTFKLNLDNIQFRFSLPYYDGGGAAYKGDDIAAKYTDTFFKDSNKYPTGQSWDLQHGSDYDYMIFSFGNSNKTE